MVKKRIIQTGVLLLLVCLATSVSACPNCKSAVAQNGGGMSAAFAWSIAMMLAVPFSIISAWTIAIRRYLRKSNAN